MPSSVCGAVTSSSGDSPNTYHDSNLDLCKDFVTTLLDYLQWSTAFHIGGPQTVPCGLIVHKGTYDVGVYLPGLCHTVIALEPSGESHCGVSALCLLVNNVQHRLTVELHFRFFVINDCMYVNYKCFQTWILLIISDQIKDIIYSIWSSFPQEQTSHHFMWCRRRNSKLYGVHQVGFYE